MTTERQTTEGILFTDEYQLTMAQLYFAEGLHDEEVRFDYFFRRYPDYGAHRAGYCVFAGLGPFLEWMERTRAEPGAIDHLRQQATAAGPRFGDEFLAWFEANGTFAGLTVDAVAEGRVIHPHEPVLSVRGPLAMAQVVETSLLNHLNYPTLIATKAARVAHAARGGAVLEFGTRRGPGRGANAGVRAALIGGADFTSNVGVSHAVGTDAKGTHAHSMVQVFMGRGGSELDAFRAYARSYPDDCLLLVDTVDTLESGLPNAIKVFTELRAAGHEPRGIRLDSGDLAALAIESARRLDAAGFGNTQIVLSSNLDEPAIASILTRIESEAPDRGVDATRLMSRLAYGVGTRLITSHGDSALGGVYKLSAVRDEGSWRPALKLSDSPGKTHLAGSKRLWRIYDAAGFATADVVSRADERIERGASLELAPLLPGLQAQTPARREVVDVEALLDPVFASGSRVGPEADLEAIRERRVADLARLGESVKDLVSPARYEVVLTRALLEVQSELAADLRAR
jgi:nicotinate phosphoribosyltransferase